MSEADPTRLEGNSRTYLKEDLPELLEYHMYKLRGRSSAI